MFQSLIFLNLYTGRISYRTAFSPSMIKEQKRSVLQYLTENDLELGFQFYDVHAYAQDYSTGQINNWYKFYLEDHITRYKSAYSKKGILFTGFWSFNE